MVGSNAQDVASDVSVMGLGAMGAAVAKTLLQGGRAVTIWNRSPGKGVGLDALGATRSSTVQDAITRSPITLLILIDAAAAKETLAQAPHAIAGKTIVNYSSGSDPEVEALEALVCKAGGKFLNGSILAYPRNVGRRETSFVYSGDSQALNEHEALLNKLSGRSVFLSAAEARAFVAAFYVQAYVALGGFFEAVAVGHRFGLESSALAVTLSHASSGFIADAMQNAAARLKSGDFNGDQATVDTHYWGFKGLAETIQTNEIPIPFFDLFLDVLERARSEGLGGEDISSLYKSFLSRPVAPPLQV